MDVARTIPIYVGITVCLISALLYVRMVSAESHPVLGNDSIRN
jgi:hypothetical protein